MFVRRGGEKYQVDRGEGEGGRSPPEAAKKISISTTSVEYHEFDPPYLVSQMGSKGGSNSWNSTDVVKGQSKKEGEEAPKLKLFSLRICGFMFAR